MSTLSPDSKAISKYLELVHMSQDFGARIACCEICGSWQQEILLSAVRGPGETVVDLPVVGCTDCGHIFQKYVFDQAFYEAYYNKYYRLDLFGQSEPDKAFFLDQVKRGDYLFKSLSNWLPERGSIFDVGCSAGGLLIPFAKRGWRVKGNDPDLAYVEYGRKIGLDISPISAEEMEPADKADLIIINGSLEHVYDVNKVMTKCHQMAEPDGLLLIEGRALGYGILQGFLTHNHRRYLSSNSIELLMLKHGWQPVLTTDDPLCGPTRPGAVFVLAKAADVAADDVMEVTKARGFARLQGDYRTRLQTLAATI